MAHRDLTNKFRERRSLINRRQQHLLSTKPDSGISPYLVNLFVGSSQKLRRGHENLLRSVEEGSATKLPKPAYAEFVDKTNELTQQLELKMEFLQKIHTRRLMVRFDESEAQQDHEIDVLTREISVLFRHSESSLQKISVNFPPNISTADKQVRVNIQRSLASRLQDMSGRFRKIQREYMSSLQLQRGKSDPFDLDDGFQSKKSHSIVDSSQSMAFASMDDYSIQAREREIQRIAKSIVDLSTVFKDLANMVIDQGTIVDCIDYNMDLVVTRMESGLKELYRAEKYQNNSRSTRCIYMLLMLISLCFCILVLKHAGTYRA
ncbi:Aste57867_1335 [Aphanomyces stellatus]|uniref:Aste57867_1335 protein n=1 Tax=Aphanomyces stellatus TaxID=120398 RepID=A0A485K4W0_9STRA|nr:hypothetical protein As57867_001334 [Aphanomyces stellatus]VFT78554.1 Aste57867_1335 [Aphanomyces stellatus]